MSTIPPSSLACFRDAYCAHRHCKPEDFETKVFLSTIQPFRFLPALFFLLVHRRLFAMDLETIRSVGKASDSKEVGRILEEFSNYNRLERGRRRGLLKIRTSGTRLMALFDRYERMITKPGPEMLPLSGGAYPSLKAASSAQQQSSGPSKQSLQNQGRIRRIQTVISGLSDGRPIAELLAEAQLTEATFLEALHSNSENNPGFAWLGSQLGLKSQLESSLQEISVLEKTIASQSRELARLRDTVQVSSRE